MAVLEIKFEKDLPIFIQEYLSKFTFKRSAIIKFALSQIRISNRPWIDPLDRPF